MNRLGFFCWLKWISRCDAGGMNCKCVECWSWQVKGQRNERWLVWFVGNGFFLESSDKDVLKYEVFILNEVTVVWCCVIRRCFEDTLWIRREVDFFNLIWDLPMTDVMVCKCAGDHTWAERLILLPWPWSETLMFIYTITCLFIWIFRNLLVWIIIILSNTLHFI